MTTIANRLLTSKEAADRLGVPLSTINWWLHTGYGPASLKVGRHRRYDPADLDAWVAAQKEANAADQQRRQAAGDGA